MSKNNKFSKGDILVQPSAPELFAIYGGKEFASQSGTGPNDYSLIAYCDTSPDNGKLLLSVDTINNIDCNYVICGGDLSAWRHATKDEAKGILKFLAEYGYKYNTVTKKISEINIKEQGFDGDICSDIKLPKSWRTPSPLMPVSSNKLKLICIGHVKKKDKESQKALEANVSKYILSLKTSKERREFLKLVKKYGVEGAYALTANASAANELMFDIW